MREQSYIESRWPTDGKVLAFMYLLSGGFGTIIQDGILRRNHAFKVAGRDPHTRFPPHTILTTAKLPIDQAIDVARFFARYHIRSEVITLFNEATVKATAKFNWDGLIEIDDYRIFVDTNEVLAVEYQRIVTSGKYERYIDDYVSGKLTLGVEDNSVMPAIRENKVYFVDPDNISILADIPGEIQVEAQGRRYKITETPSGAIDIKLYVKTAGKKRAPMEMWKAVRGGSLIESDLMTFARHHLKPRVG